MTTTSVIDRRRLPRSRHKPRCTGWGTWWCWLIGLCWMGIAQAAPHSPGRAALGTNVPKLATPEAMWLVDAFPASGYWLTQCDGCTPPPDAPSGIWNTGEQSQLQRDANGWVISFGNDPDRRFTHIAAVLFNGGSEFIPAGDWVIRYDGEASLDYDFSPLVQVVSREPGRDVLRVAPQAGTLLRIRISAINPTNHLRNLRLIAPGGRCGDDPLSYALSASECPGNDFHAFETILSSQRFHPLFLREMQTYGTLRFMQFLGIADGYLNADRLNEPQQRIAWQDRSQLADAQWATGWQDGPPPYELLFELAAVLDADIWMNLHFWADDAFIQALADFSLQHMPAQRVLYLEWNNEIWNGAPPYGWAGQRVDQWAEQKWPAAQYPGVSSFTKRMNYVGMRTQQICDIWRTAWGDQAERVRCVMPGGPWGFPAEQALDCPLYVASDGVVDCTSHIHAVAAAPYFGGYISDFSNAEGGAFEQLVTWSAQSDGGLASLFAELQSGNLAAGVSALDQARGVMQANRAVADRFGLALIAYEGGQHLTPYSPLGTSCNEWNNPAQCAPYFAIQNLYMAANRDARMGALYDDYLQAWSAETGSLFVHFAGLQHNNGQYGSWGAKEYAGQADDSAPKYLALRRWQAALDSVRLFSNGFESDP